MFNIKRCIRRVKKSASKKYTEDDTTKKAFKNINARIKK